ncbi:MAG: AraC family transcriptional regulator [Acidobacteria bacterium]|nr:MAG: AraC family transcriptional regulator [Acidobacteriota bacterium]
MKTETRAFYEAKVRQAVETVVASLARDGEQALDYSALAERAALSPFHFHRIFRGMTGETVLELHRRLRFERAAWQLGATDDSVTRIAFDAGYESHEAFTRAFRLRYGRTPSDFRAALRSPLVGEGSAAQPACVRREQFERAAANGVHFKPGSEGSSEGLAIHFLVGDETMPGTSERTPITVEIRDMPALRLVAVRHHGPFHRISEAFARLGETAGPAGLFGPDTRMVALYHDDPETRAPEDLTSDACMTVAEDVALPAGLEEIRVAAGAHACTVHRGPYQGLGDTWARFLGHWIPNSDHRLAQGPSYEIYRNTPDRTAPEDLVTELYAPIEQ